MSSVFALRGLTAASLLAVALAGAVPAAPPASARDVVALTDEVEQVLGSERLLRSFAPFTTERGESAVLVLFVTGATGPTVLANLEGPLSCPDAAAGIGLTGTYHVGLVRGGALINDVVIPCTQEADCVSTEAMSFPLVNTRYNNFSYWGQGSPVEWNDPQANVVQPTDLITLADYTADGNAWEFRLVLHGGACGHTATLLAGYSPRRREAILFPIVAGGSVSYWHDNLYPAPVRPTATSLHYGLPCLDHGNQLRLDEWYVYNPEIEAWVRTQEEQHLCAEWARDGSVRSDAVIRIGSAHGHPGDTVQFGVTIVGGSTEVRGVEMQLPVDGDFDVRGCELARDDGVHEVRATSWGIETLQLVYGMVGDSPFAPPAGEVLLYTCELAISPYASVGAHRLSASGLLVSDGWTRVPARSTDGEVLVESVGTPAAAQ